MSALARFCNMLGKDVAGYDRTRTDLTQQLEAEGMSIHYEDNKELIPSGFLSEKDKVLIVVTPAIPADHSELNWLTENGFKINKRSELLGSIANDYKCLAVAGTHGKTTITSILAHLLKNSGHGCSAFLGGITVNYGTNVLVDRKSPFCVVEADEFDRSFLNIKPYVAVISSLDADHLDIYNSHASMVEAYEQFTENIQPDGVLITKSELSVGMAQQKRRTYSTTDENADFFANNIRVEEGVFKFDILHDGEERPDFQLGLPGRHNVENALAAAAVATELGVAWSDIKNGLKSFQGVRRRFEACVKTNELAYIDDYAHHPKELAAAIGSARELYPDKKITVIFQPHLFSRTRDFADAFAESLGLADFVILLPIYPARELPISGVDSQMLLNKIKNTPGILVQKSELLEELSRKPIEVLMTLGAGDIDQFVEPIKRLLVA
jgi:UDP-N-acetylmuramate--alanine ligase